MLQQHRHPGKVTFKYLSLWENYAGVFELCTLFTDSQLSVCIFMSVFSTWSVVEDQRLASLALSFSPPVEKVSLLCYHFIK